MDSYETGRLIYLVLLGSVIAAYFLVAHRDRLGQAARAAVLWGLIFVGVVAAYGLWSDIRDDVMPRQTVFEDQARIEVPRAFDGHYYLTLGVNEASVVFVVDTGATDIVLSREDAARAGIDLDDLVYSGVAGTANGIVRTARTTVDLLQIGPIMDRDVPVWVNQGEMQTSLLGMAYLQRFSNLQIMDNKLVLER